MSRKAMYLGRQPIVDQSRNVVAYELLFRGDANEEAAAISDEELATAEVVHHLFRGFGVPTVLGRRRGFINVDRETLLGPLLDTLPPDRVVLELLEHVAPDPRVVRRCRELKGMGFSLALDDFVAWSEGYEQVLELADIVKLDVLQIEPDKLGALVDRLRPYGARLLAEKVDTMERAKRCVALGFELFQGFFFARPALLTGRA